MLRRVDQNHNSVAPTHWVRHLFPETRLGRADWFLFAATLVACFFLFLHPDLPMIGFCSVSYYSGGILEFYENAKVAASSTGFPRVCAYLPTTYAVVALWLYPLKMLGFSTNAETFQTFSSFLSQVQTLPTFETYWIKALTSLSYAASGLVFYRIALVYWQDVALAKYATAAWLTMPLAVFSQFIFSQVDVFYILLSMLGMLMLLRRRVYLAALFFGLSLTFKYFPAFIFLPCLLAFEKRVSRVALSCLIVIAPVALIELVYHRSASYQELVHGFYAVELVYSALVYVGGLGVYLLFAAFTVLCGIAYFTDVSQDAQLRKAAYLWLAASIIPFLLFFWSPQWLILAAPPIALTSMLSHRFGMYSKLDLFGMFMFIAYVSIMFSLNVDTAIIKTEWLGIGLDYSFLLGELFDWFGTHSASVFLSGFTGYLILQLVLKFKHMVVDVPNDAPSPIVHYGYVRRYFYLGLLIFALPASVAVLKDEMNDESVVGNRWVFWVETMHYGELRSGRVFEQTFVAQDDSMNWVSLFLTTFGKKSVNAFAMKRDDEVVLEIVDVHGRVIASLTRRVSQLRDGRWNRFAIQLDALRKGELYTIRLTSANASVGWWATAGDYYREGRAIVDGSARDSDFGFRIGFPR